MAIRGKDVKNITNIILLGLALISCVANGADYLGSSRRLLHAVSIVDATTLGLKAGGNCKANAAALCNAWQKACDCTTPSKLLIPPGTYDLAPVVFGGPCKNPVTVEVLGTLKATTDKSAYTKERAWLLFKQIDHLTLTGNKQGVFDGQGSCFWTDSKCRHSNQCSLELPANIKFNRVAHSEIFGFTSLNSPAFHLHVVGCINLTAHDLTITAPGDSPNTDGMHISTSCNIKVLNSKIGTGDDCISVGQGNKDITISHVECGPGHGISIGSLGKYKDETSVDKVTVTDCTLTNTTNGARIKTWLASPNLKATSITFQNLVMKMVKNPIVIDQEYGAKSPVPSRVQLSDIHFKNIRGTTTSEEGVNLVCSKTFPCQGVELCDIDLTYVGQQKITSICANAKVSFTGKQNPPPCACN